MTLNDSLIALIRTVVPTAVGVVVTWLVKRLGVPIDSAAIAAPVVVVVTAGYYQAVRWAQTKWSWVGWLLGVNVVPTYTKVT